MLSELCLMLGEDLEVVEHERKTKLIKEDEALGNLENVQEGDCIVCFSKPRAVITISCPFWGAESYFENLDTGQTHAYNLFHYFC